MISSGTVASSSISCFRVPSMVASASSSMSMALAPGCRIVDDVELDIGVSGTRSPLRIHNTVLLR